MDTQITYDFRSAKKAFSRIGIALVLFFVATFAAQLIIAYAGEMFFPKFFDRAFTYTEVVFISSLTMYLVGVPVFYLAVKGLDTFEGTVAKCSAKTFFVAFVISYSLTYIGQMIGDYLAAFIYDRFDVLLVSESIEIVSNISWVEALVFSVIIGPFFEELVFRKWIIDRTRGYGEKLSVIFSALMFAFFHTSIQQFFYTFFVGLLYGYLYTRKGKLIYCYLLHAAFNFFGAVVPLLFTAFVPDYDKFLELALTSSDFDKLYSMVEANAMGYGAIALYSLLTVAMSFVGIFWFSKRVRNLRFERAAFEIPKDNEAMTAFVNIGVGLFVLFAVAYPFLSMAAEKLL